MANLVKKIGGLAKDVKMYWNEPPKGHYMPFKEVLSYAGGGIGVKFLAVMATNMILSATNVLIGNTLGVEPIDMYIMYFISVIVNIPLSGIRANIIDNTRSKEGKYRPYIVKMGIPSAIVTILFVWFPYNQFGALFGEGTFFGKDRAYVITCAIILIFNFIQNFFYYFFSEAYDNLIHVLSPNTQERADVSTIKGVIYSLAPSILNLAMPISHSCLQTTICMTSGFTDTFILLLPYFLLCSASLFTLTQRKRLFRQRPTLSRSNLWTPCAKYFATSISG